MINKTQLELLKELKNEFSAGQKNKKINKENELLSEISSI